MSTLRYTIRVAYVIAAESLGFAAGATLAVVVGAFGLQCAHWAVVTPSLPLATFFSLSAAALIAGALLLLAIEAWDAFEEARDRISYL